MKFFKYLFSSLFAIILWAIIIGVIGFLSVRSFVNKQSISDMIRSINLSELFKDKDGNYNEAGREIRDELVENGVPEELVSEFLDAKPVVDFTANYAADFIDYIIYDSQFDKIKAQDVADLINNNVDDVFTDLRNRKVEGYELLTDDVLNEIKTNVDSIAAEVEKSLPDIKKELKVDEGQRTLDGIRLALSNTVVIILIGIVAFFSLLIILLNLKKCRFGYWLGIVYILASLPYILLFTVPDTAINIDSDIRFADDLLKYVLNRFSLYGLIFFGIGLLFLILGIVVGVMKKKKSNNNQNNSFQTPETQPVIAPTEEPIVKEEPVIVPTEEPIVEPTINNESEEKYSYCINCGTKLEPNQKFCYNCGTSKE